MFMFNVSIRIQKLIFHFCIYLNNKNTPEIVLFDEVASNN